MALPNETWSTNLPASQDVVGTEQPDLTNDTAPGAGDGHRVLVEHLHALRDKAQYLATTVGDTSDLPAGSLKDRVTDLEAAPPAHKTSHQSGGADAIKLDDLSATDDNTDLDSSTAAHGLLPKLSNNGSQFLNGVGGWTIPTGSNGGGELYTPPATPHANDEEFDGGSLPSPWVRSYTASASAVDPYAYFNSGNPREGYDGSWLAVQPVADGATNYYVSRPYTFPTNLMAWTRIQANHRDSQILANDGRIGIFIAESMTAGAPDSTRFLQFWPYETDTNSTHYRAYYYNGAYITVGNGNEPDRYRIGTNYTYCGIHKLDDVYHFWLWDDQGNGLWVGKADWSVIGATFTPAHIGFVFMNSETANPDPGNMIMSVDFMRFVESATFFPQAR